MSEPSNHDDHWRRLAAELGLDVGPAPEEPAPAHEVTPPPPHPEPLAEREAAPPARGRWPELADEGLEPTPVEEPLPARGRRGRPEPTPPDNGGLFEADSAEAAEAEIEGSDVEAAAVPEVRPEEAEEASEDIIDDQTGKRRRRRRSRRKKKPGEPAAEGAVETTGDTASDPAPTSADDEDEDEPTAEVVKNWNVPSWDELIGSLHRPER